MDNLKLSFTVSLQQKNLKDIKKYIFYLQVIRLRILRWNKVEQQNYIYLNELYFKNSDINTMSDVTKNMFCFSRETIF